MNNHFLWIFRSKINLTRLAAIMGLLLMMLVPAQMARPGEASIATAANNSWRGITPLRSSQTDVAQVLGVEADSFDEKPDGPYKVEDGEVTFSYLTASLAKLYRAPRSMIGKVFTIYFKPSAPTTRADLKLTSRFKRCTEELGKSFYYFVSDIGVAYQLRRADDSLETIIYQPTRAEISRLAVNTECVF